MTNGGGERDPGDDAVSDPFGTWPEEDTGAAFDIGDGDDVPLDPDADLDADFDADVADGDLDDAEGPHTALPPKVESWRRRSATGALLTGMALGLQQALGKEMEQPAIIMQTSGDPPMDLPVEAEVEQGRPRHSVVNIRPWLLPTRAEGGSSEVDRAIETGEPGAEDA